MAGVPFAVEGDGVGFATESYAASALYATLANRSGAHWRIRRARAVRKPKATWVDPVFIADVEYRDITSEGLLRQSSFKGLKRN
jgi:ATP-dependent DNA ligase